MIKIKDVDGKELRGLYRGINGSIVVKDSSMLSRYKVELDAKLKAQEKIKSLESEIEELKTIVKDLIGRQNGSNN